MKNKAKPILTIAIPTYNGGRYIKDALDSILMQLPVNGHEKDDIDILISDNASTDQAPDIIALYKKNHPDIISCYRQAITLHADYNFDFAVRNARGKFVWLLSDDDALFPGSLEKVLTVMNQQEDIGAVFANYRAYSSDLSAPMESHVLPPRVDMLCHPGDTYFLQTEGRNSLVSSVIIKRDLWESIDTKELMESGYVHFGAVLQVAAKAPSYIIFEPLVKMRCVKSSNRMIRGYFLGAQLGLFHIFKSLPRWGYSDSLSKKATRGLHRKVARTIIVDRGHSFEFDDDLLNRFFASYKEYLSFWVVDLPLIFLPTIFHKAIYSLYKKCQSITKNLTAKVSCK